MFPVIKVSGGAFERGRQYGSQAKHRIHRSLTEYDTLFQYYAGWDWKTATEQAQLYLPAIDNFAPSVVDELRGIADGAEVAPEEVLAINVRTEIMYSARIASAIANVPAPAECSAFASSAPGRHVVVGQNWDWAPFARDTVVVLQSEPDDGPAFVTVVEAGLLAKFGVNSAGFSVMTNAMSCTDDVGDPGVPYHVILRSLLECESTPDALARLEASDRASSANYLMTDRSGVSVDVEARPGGTTRLHCLSPDPDGVLMHTNHFVSPDFDAVDYTELSPTTSQFRLGQVTSIVAAAEDPNDEAAFVAALGDHTDYPDSVCRHPDTSLPAPEQTVTVTSAVIDLTDGRMRLSDGPPCAGGYTDVACPALWG